MRLVAQLLIVTGATALVLGASFRRQRSTHSLMTRLQLPYSESTLYDPATNQNTLKRALATLALSQKSNPAELPNRRTLQLQTVFVAALGGLITLVLSGHWYLGLLTALVLLLLNEPLIAFQSRKIKTRAQEQAPAALSILASSLEAGANLERSIELLANRIDPPLGPVFERLTAELDLGVDVEVAIRQAADRVGLEDLRWWAFAVGLQRRVGGPLAPITKNLAEMIRQRAELRQEARALTAEGRLSALVLGALPVLMFLMLQITNPTYLEPFFTGWGLIWLAATAASVTLGVAIVLRMVERPMKQ